MRGVDTAVPLRSRRFQRWLGRSWSNATLWLAARYLEAYQREKKAHRETRAELERLRG